MFEEYQALTRGTKRGSSKMSVDAGNYPNVGLKPNRGGHGIVNSHYDLELVLNCDESSPSYMLQLNNLARRSERLVDEYIPTADLRALSKTKEVNMFPTLTGPRGVFAAAAMSIDYCSSAHTDRDFFHSVLAVRTVDLADHAPLPFESNYEVDPAPVYHFVFPTIGVAVALRPGDHLIFNPNLPHCCSMKLPQYENHRTYLCAMYLKLAVIGLNDNRLPLTILQKSIIDKATNGPIDS